MEIGADTSSGGRFYLPIEPPTLNDVGLSSTHSYVMGGSGVGKTKWLEGIIRTLIRYGYGVVFIDGKSDEDCLYDNIVDYCARLDFDGLPIAEKTTLINPNDSQYSVGINYLQKIGGAESDVIAVSVIEALKKLFKEENETKVWLEEWGRAALIPLIEAGFTLLELFEFLRIDDPTFRDAVLSKLGDGFVRTQWTSLSNFRKMEQALRLAPLQTRASRFCQSRALRAIFGQEKTSIDWLKVMSEGEVVLARLGQTPRLPQEMANLIGSSILHQVKTIASDRPKRERRPFFFIVDEFQKFVNSDFADGLELMRSYGISFILSHQHRDQFKDVPEIIKSVDSCCRNKVIFSCAPSDLQDGLLDDLFSRELYEGTQEVKDEISQTKFRPVKTYEEIVTLSKSTTYSDGTSDSSGESVVALPDGTRVATDMSGAGRSGGTSRSSGTSVTRTPFLDQQEYREVSSRTYPSPEEVRVRYTALVANQPRRCAAWKFEDNRAAPFVTPTIKPTFVLDSIRQEFKERVYAQSARLTAEVLTEVDERVELFLKRVDTPKSSSTAEPKEEDYVHRVSVKGEEDVE